MEAATSQQKAWQYSLNRDNMHRVRHTKMKNSQQWENEEKKHQRYTIQTRSKPSNVRTNAWVHKRYTRKVHQCKYDRVRTLTVHRTDMIRPIKVSTRQNINGTPTRHTVHHTITIKPGSVSTMRAYTNGTAYKHDEEPSMRVRP